MRLLVTGGCGFIDSNFIRLAVEPLHHGAVTVELTIPSLSSISAASASPVAPTLSR